MPVTVVLNTGSEDDVIREVSAANRVERLDGSSTFRDRITSHRHELYPFSKFWDKFDAELSQTHSLYVQSEKGGWQPDISGEGGACSEEG